MHCSRGNQRKSGDQTSHSVMGPRGRPHDKPWGKQHFSLRKSFASVFSFGSMRFRTWPKVYTKRREKERKPKEN